MFPITSTFANLDLISLKNENQTEEEITCAEKIMKAHHLGLSAITTLTAKLDRLKELNLKLKCYDKFTNFSMIATIIICVMIYAIFIRECVVIDAPIGSKFFYLLIFPLVFSLISSLCCFGLTICHPKNKLDADRSKLVTEIVNLFYLLNKKLDPKFSLEQAYEIINNIKKSLTVLDNSSNVKLISKLCLRKTWNIDWNEIEKIKANYALIVKDSNLRWNELEQFADLDVIYFKLIINFIQSDELHKIYHVLEFNDEPRLEYINEMEQKDDIDFCIPLLKDSDKIELAEI